MGVEDSFVLSSELSFRLSLFDYYSSTVPLRLTETRKTRPFIDQPSPRSLRGRGTSPSTFTKVFIENSRRFFFIGKFWAKADPARVPRSLSMSEIETLCVGATGRLRSFGIRPFFCYPASGTLTCQICSSSLEKF